MTIPLIFFLESQRNEEF